MSSKDEVMAMALRTLVAGALALILLPVGCVDDGDPTDEGNPFLADQTEGGKEDTAYSNPDGFEVEVDFEADVVASSYRIFDAPADLAQYALTYFRNRNEFYLESIAEVATSDTRVEWQVNGEWLTRAQAAEVPVEQLRHFRIRGMNAILLHDAAQGVSEGTVFEAEVPLEPHDVWNDANPHDSCADPDGHLELSQSLYWYMWNPDRQGCQVTTQQARLTVARMFRTEQTTYPEYDQLVADGRVTAVVLFGQIGDDPLTDSDTGVRNFNQFARWLTQAGFTEVTPAPVGRRFSRQYGQVTVEMDLYSPRDFSGLDDMAHYSNFQRAITEHEIIAYDGHSMLGASDFWGRPDYPDFYQIFLYGGCLGYEYYIQPILEGKGGSWDNLDIVSSVVEVSASANQFAGPIFAKMFWALEHNYAASWRDLLVAVRQSVYDSTFGASGVSGNCFTPTGSRCVDTPVDPGTTHRYENTTQLPVPDNAPAGAASTIEVPDTFNAQTVTLELALTHTWVGDLRIVLEHNGVEAVVWDRAGGSQQNIQQNFTVEGFAGQAANGVWTLRIVDTAAQDTGTLERWALVIGG
jgi:hypothetical protein